VYDRTTRGIRIYLATPRLRGLLGLSLAVSSAGAMVLVNTVVLVRGQLGLNDTALAWTMFAFGAGSMIAALALPKLLDRFPDRPVMLTGAWLMVAALLVIAVLVMSIGLSWSLLLAVWLLIGLGNSAVLTPSGRLLRRSAHPEDRPAIFAAQFALSHACWLLTYPLAGWLMTAYGTVPALFVLAGVAALGIGVALRFWPADIPDNLTHQHPDLPLHHPHLQGQGSQTHRHEIIIDDLHRHWPELR
jgi:MFS family permease